MSSNKFLQRFEGKIQIVSKEGVHNVIGPKNQNVVVYTNNNFNPQNKNKTSTSLNKPKNIQETPKQTRNSLKKNNQNNQVATKKELHKNLPPPPPPKEKKSENPFLISNPFYLDEEERQKMQKEKIEKERLEKLQKMERQKQKQAQKYQHDSKKTTTGNLNRSLDKKKTDKEWIKLGGLGPNIGGEQWAERKKKLQKIQEFSEQVKSINQQKNKVPKPIKKEEKKEQNPRQKALQYSKNVPKPTLRPQVDKLQQLQDEQPQPQKQLSQLQLYEQRHQQLKNMLKNQL